MNLSIGTKYGKLTITGKSSGGVYPCVCDCGNECSRGSIALRRENPMCAECRKDKPTIYRNGKWRINQTKKVTKKPS